MCWIIQCKRKLSVVQTWMTKNKSVKLHNKGCHLKGKYKVTFFCTKGLSIQTNKRITTSTSLCEGPIFYFYVFTCMLESKFFSLFLFIFSFGKHHVVRKDLGTYIQLDVRQHELLLLTSPKGEYVWRQHYKPQSFSVSD